VTRNLRVLKGIRLKQFQQQGDWFTLACTEKRQETSVLLHLLLTSAEGVKHYDATLELVDKEGFSSNNSRSLQELSLGQWTWDARTVYQNMLFHEKEFQVIGSLEGISDEGCRGILKKEGSPADRTSGWRSDVFVLDGGLQLAQLWFLHHANRNSLPTGFDSLRIYSDSPYTGEILCDLKLLEKTDVKTRWDISYRNREREVVAEMNGVVLIAYDIA